MPKKSYRLNNRLTEDELDYLQKHLSDYRLEKQREQELEEFYAKTIEQYHLDALGRFCSFSEQGLERTVWEIYDETKSKWIRKAEGDKLILLNDKGWQLREQYIIKPEDAHWSDYFDMCDKLDIDPNEYNKKYFAGLMYSDEFNNLMGAHPEFLQKLMASTDLDPKTARTKIKNWFYIPNKDLEYKQPIIIYREQGPESLYCFFNKPDWSPLV